MAARIFQNSANAYYYYYYFFYHENPVPNVIHTRPPLSSGLFNTTLYHVFTTTGHLERSWNNVVGDSGDDAFAAGGNTRTDSVQESVSHLHVYDTRNDGL